MKQRILAFILGITFIVWLLLTFGCKAPDGKVENHFNKIYGTNLTGFNK